ncbi:AsmA family protein [Rhizobium leguminosarum bv. viciae]|uniref:AsmA family protein n=1 Tax=Rhizobium leguminosarum bv. viciae TaxID=387 RepID=A0A8I2GU81_RHILV|nr:AsmA-like C-terminal region-containing protein [Rhizobium leguminosarum]MBY5791426.1 AsmA family protein [Rhizobium leguminosarum]NKM46585.1 AsmA family protein [Rhizobium leguminosarum bv. viciae]
MVGRFLVFLGGVIVVVLFVALLAPLFIDWTDFRKNFEDQASRIIGKKVTVYGTVDARLLPFPSVTLHDVRVGQEADGTPIVKVEQFSMDAELAPFLSGEALIFDMRIVNPKVRLRLLKDGTLDWMRGSRAEIPARTVVLENVHVSGGEVEFIDDQSGRSRRITGLNAEMSAKSLAGPWRIEGDAALDGEHGGFSISSSQPDEKGVLRMRTRLSPDKHPVSVDLDGELKLVDSKPNYQGQLSAAIEIRNSAKPANKKEQPPRVKGRFELTNERIRIPEYRMEIGPTDDPYVITGEATLDTGNAPEFLLTAVGQQIDVNRIGNQGSAGKTTRDPAVSARQRLNSLIDIVAQVPIPQVPGKASVKLPAIVAGDTTLRDVQLELEPAGTGWMIDSATGTLPGRTQVEGKGKLLLQGEPSFNGQIVVASSQPTGLASWLAGSVDPAIRQLRQAGFSANVSLTHELQRFENLEIAIGPATLKGRLERQAISGQTPTLSVALNGDTLDLDALQALSGLMTGQDAGDNVLDHKIAAQLKADKFTAFGVDAENVETTFTIADGALAVDRLSIKNIAGAELTATGRAEGSLLDYKGAGEITFKSADPGGFFTMLREHLPHHPVLDRLVRNAGWYGNTALRGALTLGGDEGDALTVTLAGVANGSRVNLDYRMSDLLALTGNGTTSLEATLENPVPSVLFGQAGLDPLPVDVGANGRLTLKVKASGNDPADAALTFATDRTSFMANGKVDVRPETFMNGQIALSLDSADIDPYLIMNGIALPQTGTGLPFGLQVNTAVDSDKIVFSDLKGHAADNEFSGALTFDRKAAKTTASGGLTLAKADAGWLGEAVFGQIVDPANGQLTTAALGLPIFKDLDVNVKLAAKEFWPGLPETAVSDFTSNVAYKGDELQLNDMAGNWDGGKLSGNLLFTNASGTGFLQTKLALADSDLSGVVWLRDGAPIANGKFGLSLSMEASGKTIGEIASSLNGSGELRLGDTSIRGLNLAILPPLLAATDTMQEQINAGKVHPIIETLLSNGEAKLPPLGIPFNIADGTLRVQNVTVANDLARITADAQIALPEERISATLGVGFNPGTEALSGAEPALRLNFSGMLPSPGKTMDVTDITSYLSLRAFERERRRVERLQAVVLEKQRLRREVALYRFNDAERIKAAEIERQRQAEEERLRALAQKAAAEKAAAEAEAARAVEAKAKADADAQARAAAEAEAARRSGQAQPGPLNFDQLPGIQAQ